MRTVSDALWISVLWVGAPVSAANLAPQAAYQVTVSGYVYPGQVLPGTNTPATAQGFLSTPPWQGPTDTLTDGRRDSAAVTSWFWSQMDKRITVRLDLRRPAALTAVRAWPRTGTGGWDYAAVRVAASAEDLAGATQQALVQAEADGMAWQGQALTGRFVELVCASGAPQMSLAEVDIEGEATGDVAADAPAPGLVPVQPRDLAPLVRLPDRPPGTNNMARGPGVRVTVSSRHYDDRTGAWSDDTCAAASDPDGRTLVDGDPATAVRSFSGWYAAKRVRVEIAPGQAARFERVVVWSAGHETGRCFINCVKLWVQAGDTGAWTPAGEVWNPLRPGETPAPQYPIASAPVGRVATRLRLELEGVAQSADLMQVGEVEVWGAVADRPVVAAAWRTKHPVPPVLPVAVGTLDGAYDWLQRDRLRGLYTYVGKWQDTDLLEHAVAAGFNCLLVHTMGKTHSGDGWPAEAEQWCRVQRERDLRILISWPFGSDERYGNTQFGAYQPGGVVTWKRGPCPLAREYWDRVVGDRAVIAAKAGLTGLVVDMEMYGADATRYPGPCCCDACWGRFVADHLEGIAAADVPLPDRPAWIGANGLAADYSRWQELQVSAILGDIRQRVRDANPLFLLGNLLDPESLAGLARGFGTGAMPALVFSELEYHGGIAGVAGRVAHLRRQGYPVWYLPGLWIKPVTPPQLPQLVSAVGPDTGGFWIWSTASLAPGATGEYALAPGYTAADFWTAFHQANAALTEALRARPALPPTPVSPGGPRALVPRVPGPDPTPAEWTQAAVLSPLVCYRSGAPAQAATTVRALWDGQRLHLRVRCDEPELEKMPPLYGARDEPTLWQQDSIEIFWRRADSEAYVHVVVNAAGTVADSFSDGIRPEEPGWDADIRATARRAAAGWELELALPLAADGRGRIGAGDDVRFELARNRPGAGEITCWAPTGGMFRGATNLWGTLELR